MRYYIEHLPMTIPAGVQSENNAEAVEFDVSDWLARDGSLSFSVWVTRPGETESYQADNMQLKDGVLYWWPTSADTAIAGDGRVEILAVSAKRRKLSGWTATSIRETTTETTTDAPVDQRPWLDQALLASEEAKAAATSAAASADQAEGVVKKEIATLTEDVARDTAPPIIPTATGEIVTVSDSANRPLAGLRLYGKTTQNGTPAPDSPVPLKSVGDGWSIWVKATGKNLMSKTTDFSLCGVNITCNGGAITLNGTANASGPSSGSYTLYLPEGRYTLSIADTAGSINSTGDNLLRAVGGGNTLCNLPMTAKGHASFTHPGGGLDIAVRVNNGSVFTSYTLYVQLEKGDAVTSYNVYRAGGGLGIDIANGLLGIPVTSGGNYTDENGQQWVCDEVDFERGVYVQRVAQATVTGATGKDSSGKLFVLKHDGAAPALAPDHTVLMMCDHYVPMSLSAVRAAESGIAHYGETFYIRDSRWSTVSDATQALQAMGCKFVYKLATPVETPLSADDLAEYRAMTSQYPISTVYNESDAGMQVDYIADTKNYIDQKLAAIAAAVL